uniref:DUF3825 domain-containing protein n=1 Tax=Caenorhabditis tropicalis TaxID=1561998 RepID=A0A1I7TBM7_9PELO
MTAIPVVIKSLFVAYDAYCKKCEMNEGYKMTQIPVFPKVMENTESFKVMAGSNGDRMLGLTLDNESNSRVCYESLEFIRKWLKGWFVSYDEMLAQLEEPFPENTIAVSFGAKSFQIGNSCAEFYENKRTQGSFSYQKISPNVMVTYFNKDDINFLAGFTYFPVLRDAARCFGNDRAALYMAIPSIESFPLRDRAKTIELNKAYGRYCSVAKKRVVVEAKGKYPMHLEYDALYGTFSYIMCEECLVDSVTYKWKDPSEADSSVEIAQKLQELADNGTGTVEVFHTRGSLSSSEKRIVDLKEFLEANPSFNVHSKHALIAKIVLGEEFKDRIGGEPVEQAEPTEVAKVAPEPTEVAKTKAMCGCGMATDSKKETLTKQKDSSITEFSDSEASEASEDSKEAPAEFDSDVDAVIVN